MEPNLNTLTGGTRGSLSTFRNPNVDLGHAVPFTASVQSGFQSSLTGVGWRALKYHTLKNGAEMSKKPGSPQYRAEDWITAEEFDKDFGLGGKLKFEDMVEGKMYKPYAQTLMEDTVDDMFNEARANMGGHTKTQLAGNLVGGLLSPVDWALSAAVPEIQLARFGYGATVASRAGAGGARIASKTINGAVGGAVEGAATMAPYAALSEYTQNPVSLEEVIIGLGLSPLMGAVVGAGRGVLTNGQQLDRHLANLALHTAAGGGKAADLDAAISSSPVIRELLDHRNRTVEAVASPERTPEQSHDVSMASGDIPYRRRLEKVEREIKETTEFLDRRKNEDHKANKRLIDEAVAVLEGRASRLGKDKNPITRAVNDDEKFLSEAWQSIFGVELRYLDPVFSRELGMSGFVRSGDPGVAYIRRGHMDHKELDRSMLFLAGHELGHSIRFRSPGRWKQITDAIIATADQDGGVLDRAWLNNSMAKRDSGVWAGLDMWRKMDEAYASVLGDAMRDARFWQALNAKSPSTASGLVQTLTWARNKLSRALGSTKNRETIQLYEEMSAAIMVADDQGRNLSQVPGIQRTMPNGDKIRLDGRQGLYTHQGPKIVKFQRRMSELLNERGTQYEAELANYMEMLQQIAPVVGRIEDESSSPGGNGRLATVIRNKKVTKRTPGAYILELFFKHYDEKALRNPAFKNTKEYKTYLTWRDKGFRWDFDVYRKEGRKSWDAAALKDFPPLVAMSQNADGTWDFAIYKNDDFPSWSENLRTVLDNDVEGLSKEMYNSHLYGVREAFEKYVRHTRKPIKDEDGNPIKPDTPSYEFDGYLTTLTKEELDEMVVGDPDALWQGYMQHIENGLAEYRLKNNEAAYNNLAEIRREIDPLLKSTEEGKSLTADEREVAATELKAAWEDFRKNQYPELQKFLTDEKLGTDRALDRMKPSSTQSPEEFFTGLFKEVRRRNPGRDGHGDHDDGTAALRPGHGSQQGAVREGGPGEPDLPGEGRRQADRPHGGRAGPARPRANPEQRPLAKLRGRDEDRRRRAYVRLRRDLPVRGQGCGPAERLR